MAKKRPPSMNLELLEYLKFLHLHNLVDIIAIIESIPIYYQTQIKKYGGADTAVTAHTHDYEYIKLQKLRLQNLTYIAQKLFKFKFPSSSSSSSSSSLSNIEFQTWRHGPYSLDLENECNNLIYSDVFNNAISSKKTFDKRYNIVDYDKKRLIDMFNSNVNYYRKFLNLVEGKNVTYLRDIAIIAYLHSYYTHDSQSTHPLQHRFYVRSFTNKHKLLCHSLRCLMSPNKKDLDGYINELINLYFRLRYLINRR